MPGLSEFKESYRYFYERDYGSQGPVVDETVDRFSKCGMFHNGFARIRCPECCEEYLLADGTWGKGDDAFQSIVWRDADILSSAFRQQVLAMMVSKRHLSAECACYVHYPAENTLSLPAFRAEVH